MRVTVDHTIWGFASILSISVTSDALLWQAPGAATEPSVRAEQAAVAKMRQGWNSACLELEALVGFSFRWEEVKFDSASEVASVLQYRLAVCGGRTWRLSVYDASRSERQLHSATGAYESYEWEMSSGVLRQFPVRPVDNRSALPVPSSLVTPLLNLGYMIWGGLHFHYLAESTSRINIASQHGATITFDVEARGVGHLRYRRALREQSFDVEELLIVSNTAFFGQDGARWRFRDWRETPMGRCASEVTEFRPNGSLDRRLSLLSIARVRPEACAAPTPEGGDPLDQNYQILQSVDRRTRGLMIESARKPGDDWIEVRREYDFRWLYPYLTIPMAIWTLLFCFRIRRSFTR